MASPNPGLPTGLTLLWHKLRRLQGSAPALALGTAVGVFIGIAPLMPFKSLLIVLITVVAGGSTIAALLVCTLICNPLTYLPLYSLAWLAGNLLLPARADWTTLQAAMDRIRQAGLMESLALIGEVGFDAGLVLLVGGLLLALPLSLASYPLALRFFVRIEQNRRRNGEIEPI